MAQIYTFKITYRGCEDKIWRIAEVSSNNTLAQLGYTVLATFDTMAYHLFNISVHGETYELDTEEEDIDEAFRLCAVKLSSLHLQIGDRLEMIYDFGYDQMFDIEFTAARDMPRGHGRAYPRIVAGEGRGIIDDLPADELAMMIYEIDRTGVSPFKYLDKFETLIPWDYRNYNLECDNILLKGEVSQIQSGYED